MIVNCTNCNKEFHKRAIFVKRSINHFCEPNCYYEWKTKNPPIPHNKKEKIKYSCDTCQTEMLIENWVYQKIISGTQSRKYCSKECRLIGESLSKKGESNKQFNRVLINCSYCDKEYLVKLHLKEKSKFCSNECKNMSRKTQLIEIECCYCNKKLYKKRHRIKEKNFCDVQCANKYRETKIEKICVVCDKIYKAHAHNADKRVVCSKKCTNVWLSEIYSKDPIVKQLHRQNGINSVINQQKYDTKPELMVKTYLQNNGIEFISQYPMYNMFVVDFYLPKQNIVIEVLGDYWHGHPDKYGDEEGKKPLTEKQIKNKKKDGIRYKYLTKAGHQVHMIWECDIYQDIDESMSFLVC